MDYESDDPRDNCPCCTCRSDMAYLAPCEFDKNYYTKEETE